MKKSLVAILIWFAVIGLNGSLYGAQTNVNPGPPFATKPANVITVAQSGGDFTTITDALASLPDPNTTPVIIKVMPGTYTENIAMKSYVNLQGAGRDITTIVGDIIISWGTSVTDVTISDFKISGGYIKADGTLTPDQKVTITGNYIIGLLDFAMWNCSPYFVVSDNIITGNNTGINMGGCRAIIRNNTITNNSGDGIRNSGDNGGFSSDALIVGNVISNNGSDGIYNTGNSKVLIKDNVITSNGNNGINNSGTSGPTIIGNTIANNGEWSTNYWEAGIINYNNSTVTIKDNTIEGNPEGIVSNYCLGNTCGDAYASTLVVKNNIIRNNLCTGITIMSNMPSAHAPSLLIDNIIAGNDRNGLNCEDVGVMNTLVSHNVFDRASGVYFGHFNEKSDGTLW